MSETETSAFVPVLTVMVDYGNAPFLWLVERPDQVASAGCSARVAVGKITTR